MSINERLMRLHELEGKARANMLKWAEEWLHAREARREVEKSRPPLDYKVREGEPF
jgi:hypothetical protein